MHIQCSQRSKENTFNASLVILYRKKNPYTKHIILKSFFVSFFKVYRCFVFHCDSHRIGCHVHMKPLLALHACNSFFIIKTSASLCRYLAIQYCEKSQKKYKQGTATQPKITYKIIIVCEKKWKMR